MCVFFFANDEEGFIIGLPAEHYFDGLPDLCVDVPFLFLFVCLFVLDASAVRQVVLVCV